MSWTFNIWMMVYSWIMSEVSFFITSYKPVRVLDIPVFLAIYSKSLGIHMYCRKQWCRRDFATSSLIFQNFSL